MLLNRASGWRKRFIVDVGTLKIMKLSKKGTGPLFLERKEEKEGNLSRTATALPRVVETRPSERDCCAHKLFLLLEGNPNCPSENDRPAMPGNKAFGILKSYENFVRATRYIDR